MDASDFQSTGTPADSGTPQPANNGPVVPAGQQANPAPDLGSGNPPPQNGQVAPQAQPAPPGQPAENLPPGRFFKNLSHSFAGAVLASLAGRQPAKYVVDATGKTVPDPSQLQETSGDKLRRIASNALAGLAAGAAAPQQKSKFASAAAGFGAGAEAVTQKATQADDKSRAQAGEDFEREQQLILRKHDIARGNMLNLSTMQHVNQEDIDHDPERQKNLALAKAAEDAGVPVTYLSESDAKLKYKQDPKTLISEHVLMPVGMKPVTDAQGNQVFEQDGTPKMEGQLVAINGMHDGTFTPPASFYEDAKKYAKYGGVSEIDTLDPATPITVENFNRLHAAILEGKKSEHQGWVKPEEVLGGPDGKTPMQRNTSTGELRAYPSGVKPNIKNEASESAATVAEKDAITKKDLAEAGKAKAETAQTTGPNAGLVGEDFLKTLPAGDAAQVRAIGEGRQELSAGMLRTKDGQALSKKVQQAYPDFDATRSTAYAATRKDFTSGKTSVGINAFNTALAHASRMVDHISAAGTIPGVNNIARALGNEKAAALNIDRTAVATEMAKAYKGGQITEGEKNEWESKLNVASPTELRNNLKEFGELLQGKLEAYQTQWENGLPKGVVAPVKIISTTGQAAYDHITGKKQAGQSAQLPREAVSALKEGVHTTFKNGQTWTLQNGQPVQIGSN